LYQVRSEAARDEKNHFKQSLFCGYLVLYHRSENAFPSAPPLLDVGIPAAEIAGVTFRPAVLSQELSGFPAGLLPGTDSGIGPKVPPTEVTSFEQPGPPVRRR
jgi:hypothetical protein